MATTARWLGQVSGERAVVHVDPFDPYARCESGPTALEFAADVVEHEHVQVYWYGYDAPEGAAWAYHALGELTGRPLWCGDAMVVGESGRGTSGDLGVATTPGTGCGVLLGNVANETAGERLGRISSSPRLRCSPPTRGAG